MYMTHIYITGNVTLTNNLAAEEGGGMYVSRSTVNCTGNKLLLTI